MKFTLALVAGLVPLSRVSASVIPKRDLETRAPCGDSRITGKWLGAWNGVTSDHFYTTNAGTIQNAVSHLGYQAEGTAGYIFSNQQPGTVPFYRLWSLDGTDHFYTTSADERDNAIAHLTYQWGVAGYVYPNLDADCDSPLYRSYSAFGNDHRYSISAAETHMAGASGWAIEGVEDYCARHVNVIS